MIHDDDGHVLGFEIADTQRFGLGGGNAAKQAAQAKE
jgi:hypothetical protein